MQESVLALPWHVAVLIPARNEEALLGRCLRSVRHAASALPRSTSVDIVVVSDTSDDDTEKIAAAFLGDQGVVRRVEEGCVGATRAHAAEVALTRYGGPLTRCWLANTDADCVVPPNWLTAQLATAQKGIDAVAGIVDVDDFTEHQPRVESLFRLTYLIHPDGTHPHVHGANLGMRADAYLAAGGWAPQMTAEDHDLWRRLRGAGLFCVADARLRVITSGRRTGRAPSGFAAALAAHNEAKP